MPFHDLCFKIFAQVLRNKTAIRDNHWNPDTSIVDKDILFDTMSSLFVEYQRALNLNYNELDEHKREQYWECRDGDEVSYFQ